MVKPYLEIIPAILAKTEGELLERVAKVRPYVNTIHIDVMDGQFVPNTTVGIHELLKLPKDLNYEFHWMVKRPERWINSLPLKGLHFVHFETIDTWARVEEAVERVGGTPGLALNPETPVEEALHLMEKVDQVLVMGVNPGFSAQQYIPAVEEKIRKLRERFPQINIEVDGGINTATAGRVVRAGANKLAAASAIFGAEWPAQAIRELRQAAEEGRLKL